jgi:hypothetical protein
MPRGLTHLGSLDQSAVLDMGALLAFLLPPTNLTGSADAISPSIPGNYIVKTAGVDAMTLTAPSSADDGLMIAIFSDTTNAHTLTATSLLANGTALKTTATFGAFKGAGLVLRAVNGVWHVIMAVTAPLT